MVTADHGPAVSGAHNTIVCARAGKDLVSSLVSGLLTVVRISDLMKFILVSLLIGVCLRESNICVYKLFSCFVMKLCHKQNKVQGQRTTVF